MRVGRVEQVRMSHQSLVLGCVCAEEPYPEVGRHDLFVKPEAYHTWEVQGRG